MSKMRSKRDYLAAAAQQTGVLWALEQLPKRNCLVVLAYHRIGDSDRARFDPAVFDATADEFDWQLSFIKKNYSFVTLDEGLDLVSRNRSFAGVAVLVTFDDGYIDNYQIAFPILRSHGIEGTFFLVTSYVGSSEPPWWDRIADLVKRSERKAICLQYPRDLHFSLEDTPRHETVRRLLKVYKNPETDDPDRFLTLLEEACAPLSGACKTGRVFLDWTEAAEMQVGGMKFGSHTHTHPVLGKLSPECQHEEIAVSRSILCKRLGVDADALAYPVGSRNAFSAETYDALERSGYRAAFSYYGGVNFPSGTQRYDIRRVSVDRNPSFRFRTQMALAPLANGMWF